MGRRGWALTIFIGLAVIMVVIVIFRSGDEFSTTEKQKWKEQVISGHDNDRIVQLFVSGVISEGGGGFSNSFNTADFISQLNQAKKDKSIKGIVIRVNSPGGEVVASDEIHNKILEMKQSGKPVVVSMGAVAASGGYYISAPASRIFANPSTITGSLGVVFSIPNYQKAANTIGYEVRKITSGAYKDIGNPLREMSSSEKDIFQGLVNESYQRFVEVIEKGRGLSHDQVLKLADGRVYSGKQAKELGLIDEWGSLEDATAYAAKAANLDNPKIVRYKVSFSLSSMLYGMNTAVKLPMPDLVGKLLPDLSAGPKLLYLFES